jgi:hypothetical protein
LVIGEELLEREKRGHLSSFYYFSEPKLSLILIFWSKILFAAAAAAANVIK